MSDEFEIPVEMPEVEASGRPVELIPDGIHPYLAEWKYRKDPAVAVSDIKEMQYSPAHFYSKKFGGYRPHKSEAQNIGTLVHLAVLEPERFPQEVVLDPADAPKRPTKVQREAKKPSEETLAAIKWWDDWNKEHGHKTVVSAEELAQINGIRDQIMSHKDAAEIISLSDKEVAMFNTIETNGHPVRVKGKADLVGRGSAPWMADIKTVDRGYANPTDFVKSINKWSYHMQAAWYLDLFNSLGVSYDPFSTSAPKKRWIFIVAEKEPPFAVCTLELDEGSIDVGRKLNQFYREILADCLRNNRWPGPPQQRGLVSINQWQKRP